MKKRYVIFTAIIAIIAICGLLVPEQQGIWTLSDNIKIGRASCRERV